MTPNFSLLLPSSSGLRESQEGVHIPVTSMTDTGALEKADGVW